ncbi:MAG: ABC transporter permease, partial [Pseudobdellovibrionaceae bacterium]
SVASIVGSRFSHTWILNLIVICLVIFLSFVLSFMAFYSQRIKRMIFFVHRLIFSLPILFLAPMSIFVFSFYFELLPFAFLDTKLNYILPVFVLCLRPIAVLSQIQIRNQDEIQKQNFMQVAKAKGLTEQRLFFVHTLKNSLPMTASYLPDTLVGLVSGSFLVEMLFSIPGLGLLFVESIGERDYPMIVGITLVLGALFIFLSQLVETLQHSLDPRKRIQLV